MNTLIMPMAYLEVGQKAEIVSVELNGSKRMRMMDLGVTVGTKVQCVLKNRQGSPAAYDVRGSVFAFREEDSKRILIKCNKADFYGEACL